MFEKHVRGSTFSRSSNFVTCSCGWSLATDGLGYGEWAIGKWTEHVIDAMQDALAAQQQ